MKMPPFQSFEFLQCRCGKGLIGPCVLCGEYVLSLRGYTEGHSKCPHFEWPSV